MHLWGVSVPDDWPQLVSAAVPVVIAFGAVLISRGSRLDAQFKRVDDLLIQFQTGELSAARHLIGTYLHGNPDVPPWSNEHTKAVFDVLWFFNRAHTLSRSLPKVPMTVRTWKLRNYLLDTLEPDIRLWNKYMAGEDVGGGRSLNEPLSNGMLSVDDEVGKRGLLSLHDRLPKKPGPTRDSTTHAPR